eukprot:GHVT01050840.1.p1 GENE.GHVT01050840.1~~GHVT01050840.1.p1  ORF type:complete len:325 (+),score=35.78 GHVT01050840.1:1338-2312(+)
MWCASNCRAISFFSQSQRMPKVQTKSTSTDNWFLLEGRPCRRSLQRGCRAPPPPAVAAPPPLAAAPLCAAAGLDPAKLAECLALLWGGGKKKTKSFLASRFKRRLGLLPSDSNALHECLEKTKGTIRTETGEFGVECLDSRYLIVHSKPKHMYRSAAPLSDLTSEDCFHQVEGAKCIGSSGTASVYKLDQPCVAHRSDTDGYLSFGCDLMGKGLNHVYNEFLAYLSSNLSSAPATTHGLSPAGVVASDTPNSTSAAFPVENSTQNDPQGQAFDPKIFFSVLSTLVTVAVVVAAIVTFVKLGRCRKSPETQAVVYRPVTKDPFNA